MTDGNKIRDDVRVAEDAAGWFARLQGEAATGDDWLAFERWLGASPAHALAYEKLERLWIELDQVEIARGLGAPPPPPRRPLPLRVEARRGGTRRAWLGAGAAVAAGLAMVVIGAGGFHTGGGAGGQVYRTAPGETRTVTLADGSHIRLNAASQITVRFSRGVRQVQMADAEAVFDVAHDASRPFLISVGDRQVRVVGTQFNLRHRDGRVALTVRRGVVEVRPADALQAEPTRVTVGQQLTHDEGKPVQALTLADGDAAFAWTNGQLIYRDRPLSEVAGDLSRRFATPVRAADPETAAMRFTGVLVTDREADVLRRLGAFAPIRVERAGGAVILHRKG